MAAAAAAAAYSLQPGGTDEMARVRRKKDFRQMERVVGRMVNVLEGLELHSGVFSPAEQRQIVACVLDFQDRGRRGLLRRRTYSEPLKWMRGKGRATIQFGCCYNYASDRDGNPPGIIRAEEVDQMPPLLKAMIRRMVEWRVLPANCVPNSCIVNIYERDDCIPPHIDHHDFLRPFCTVSFLAECSILFGRELKVLSPGEFTGAASIPLPVGSVLVLKGNGADVAKHCVPAVPAKRISITFRKMDDSKLPFKFVPDQELQGLVPLPHSVRPAAPTSIKNASPGPARTPQQQEAPRDASAGGPARTTPATTQQRQQKGQVVVRVHGPTQLQVAARAPQSSGSPFTEDDFPALGSAPASGRRGRRCV